MRACASFADRWIIVSDRPRSAVYAARVRHRRWACEPRRDQGRARTRRFGRIADSLPRAWATGALDLRIGASALSAVVAAALPIGRCADSEAQSTHHALQV